MNTTIGVALPKDLFINLKVRVEGVPKGISYVVKEALRIYFESNPLTDEQKAKVEAMMVDSIGPAV